MKINKDFKTTGLDQIEENFEVKDNSSFEESTRKRKNCKDSSNSTGEDEKNPDSESMPVRGPKTKQVYDSSYNVLRVTSNPAAVVQHIPIVQHKVIAKQNVQL
jgi:hypothetical protein